MEVVRCLRYTTTQGFEPLAWGPHPDVFFCDGDPATGNQLYHLRHIIIRTGILDWLTFTYVIEIPIRILM